VTGVLHEELADYLTLRRALGYRLARPEKLLGQFLDHLDRTGESRITVVAALDWARLPVGGSPNWWAYRLGHTDTSWVGVVTATGKLTASVLDAAAGRLGISPAALTAEGRRPAWVQRADQPVAGRRIAAGDAALAHDPIAGQGIRFALGSAIAAAATVATWADDPSRRPVATDYYRGLVEAEEARHRTVLEGLANPDPAATVAEPGPLPAVVRFDAALVQAELSVDGRVELGPAVRLRDGATVRWVGAFDLLDLARLAVDPTPQVLVVAGLLEIGLDVDAARALVTWAVRNGVLVDASQLTS